MSIFGQSYQLGPHEIFCAAGLRPLQLWKIEGTYTENHSCSQPATAFPSTSRGVCRSYDKALHGCVVQCSGGSMSMPKSQRLPLGLTQPLLIIQAYMEEDKASVFELTVSNDRGCRHTLTLSNAFRELKTSGLSCSIPLSAPPNGCWCTIAVNMADMLDAFCHSTFRSLDRMTIHGISTVRRMYTTNELVAVHGACEGGAVQTFETPRQFQFPSGLHTKWQLLDAQHLLRPAASSPARKHTVACGSSTSAAAAAAALAKKQASPPFRPPGRRSASPSPERRQERSAVRSASPRTADAVTSGRTDVQRRRPAVPTHPYQKRQAAASSSASVAGSGTMEVLVLHPLLQEMAVAAAAVVVTATEARAAAARAKEAAETPPPQHAAACKAAACCSISEPSTHTTAAVLPQSSRNSSTCAITEQPMHECSSSNDSPPQHHEVGPTISTQSEPGMRSSVPEATCTSDRCLSSHCAQAYAYSEGTDDNLLSATSLAPEPASAPNHEYAQLSVSSNMSLYEPAKVYDPHRYSCLTDSLNEL